MGKSERKDFRNSIIERVGDSSTWYKIKIIDTNNKVYFNIKDILSFNFKDGIEVLEEDRSDYLKLELTLLFRNRKEIIIPFIYVKLDVASENKLLSDIVLSTRESFVQTQKHLEELLEESPK